MSAREAAGWALSRFQAVSVVPTIQCRPQGITKSTDVAVRRMIPDSERIRSRGTTRWIPLLAWTLSYAPAADHLLDLVGPDPGGVDHHPWPGRQLATGLQVARGDPDDPLTLPQEAGHPGPRGDVGAVVGGGPGEHHRVPGVVDLAVVVLHRAGQRVRAEVGGDQGAPGGG